MAGRVKWLLLVGGLFLLTWWLARPQTLGASDLVEHQADPARGEQVFHAGGCGSCHGDTGAGGEDLLTPAGVFRAPNITPHAEDGIGGWTDLDFANAMLSGVAPDGRHYYPSFPYTSYTRMKMTDVMDLKAYLDTLAPVTGKPPGHELSFPFGIRWPLGLWKRIYLDASPVVAVNTADPQLERGRYLVEGPGHCGECHTPRNLAMATIRSAWLAGAPLPEGEGKASNLTPAKGGLADWRASDIAFYLETGVDPDFDVVGGPMVDVQENMARLSDADRQAIAAYLKALPR